MMANWVLFKDGHIVRMPRDAPIIEANVIDRENPYNDGLRLLMKLRKVLELPIPVPNKVSTTTWMI